MLILFKRLDDSEQELACLKDLRKTVADDESGEDEHKKNLADVSEAKDEPN